MPLARELELVRAYLKIEGIRFGDRLRVNVEADDDVLTMAVPPLVLQPIVENAVRHGVAPHARAGRVAVHARRNGGGRVVLEVRDSGDGADEETLSDGGQGLDLTRRRLESLFPSDYSISFLRGDGFTVRVELPGVPLE